MPFGGKKIRESFHPGSILGVFAAGGIRGIRAWHLGEHIPVFSPTITKKELITSHNIHMLLQKKRASKAARRSYFWWSALIRWWIGLERQHFFSEEFSCAALTKPVELDSST
jgi:hypothetical protein